MTELPSGTVTFLFTDIERSTQSAAALGDGMWAEALQTHNDLIRCAIEKHGGVEVGREGDSFFVAFARATDAVTAAIDGQRALETYSWPGDTRLRVRMGVHTGEALVRDEGYVGHEVHRAKRISDAAHGGQILVSQTTADLIGGVAEFVDLGAHRLKDLGEPQRLYQVTDEGLPSSFPPLRGLDSFTHSLPQQRSAFIGREKEIAEVIALLEANRMMTLTGVGGCGKTRLALQVGAEVLERFSDGVFFVNLAPVSDPDAVVREIATSVGAPLGGGLTNLAPIGPIDEVLLARLAARTTLLILDNCEHLVDECAEMADRILARCPEVRILATSREALRVEGEQSWSVPSLSLPAGDGDAQSSESVSLFKARAKAVRPDFELKPDNIGAVVEICRRLDGIPLAIEFAAARVGHLSPRQIADRLDDRFRLLTGGQRRVQRQHTLQAALDWSYELLEEPERILLRRLSVFSGDFGIEAAEGVCADEELDVGAITDLLGSLVAKSLVDTELWQGEARYRLLETVCAYAAQRLAQEGEAERFRSRHRDWYLGWVESVSLRQAIFEAPFNLRIDREKPDLQAALEWSAGEERFDLVGRIAVRFSGMGRRFFTHQWAQMALDTGVELDPDGRLALRLTASFREFFDGTGLGPAGISDGELEGASPEVSSYVLALRGGVRAYMAAATGSEQIEASAHEDFDRAQQLTGELGGEGEGFVLWQRANSEAMFGRARVTLSLLEETIQSFEAAGNELLALAFKDDLACVAHLLNLEDEAARAWEAHRSRWDPDTGTDLGLIAIYATVAAAIDGHASAWAFLRSKRSEAVRSGVEQWVVDLVLGCAVVHAIEGDHVRASELLSCVRAHTLAVGRPLVTGIHYLLYLHYRDIVRQALGPEPAREARARGEQLSLEDAVERAFASKIPA